MTTIIYLLAALVALNLIRLCLAVRQQHKLAQLAKRQQDEWQKMQAGFLAWMGEVNDALSKAPKETD